jgi:hypothetical protein
VPSDEQRAAAAERLSPEDRALIQLFDRGMGAEEIAGVVGLEPAEVERRHRSAQVRLAEELRREEAPAARGKRRAPIAAALAVLLIGAVVAIALAAGGGDDDSGGGDSGATDVGATTPDGETTTAPAEPETRPVTMRRLNGTYGRGTAQIVDGRLRLDVDSFLRPVGGGYAVWLYNSADDARRLYATTDTSIQRDFRLPDGYEEYRYVEVARAVPELDSDHSGLTLLRVPLSALTQS